MNLSPIFEDHLLDDAKQGLRNRYFYHHRYDPFDSIWSPGPICVSCSFLFESQASSRARNGFIFSSSRCKQSHFYCNSCVARLMTQSLSLLNEMPTCIVPECNEPFKFTITQSISLNAFLSFPYQAQKINIKQYQADARLVHGYIRQKSQNNHSLMPLDLISIIHDFYKLVCYTLLDCTSCYSVGYHTKPCSKCDARGYTELCLQCVNGQITSKTSEPCPSCGGFGHRVSTRLCECGCLHDQSKEIACNACDGWGIRRVAGRRGECASCDGTGRTPRCVICLGIGTICTVDDCELCKGERVVSTVTTCGVCLGSGNHTQKCTQCSGKGTCNERVCYDCNGNGGLLCTDFNKVIRKQKYCHKCNLFYPQNTIMNWSDCGHTFCHKCLITSRYIETELVACRIPLCMANKCTQELNDNFDYPLETAAESRWRLRRLKFIKDKFRCCVCKEWHLDKAKILFSRCGHALVKKCAVDYISRRINARTIPKCPDCGVGIETEDISAMCGARYMHIVEALLYNTRMKALIVSRVTFPYHRDIQDVSKVLKLRNANLYAHDAEIKDKLLDLVSLTSIKVEDMDYIQIVASRSGIALFKLCFKNVQSARNIWCEVSDLIQKNSAYRSWYVGWWEVHHKRNWNHNQRRSRYNQQDNWRSSHNGNHRFSRYRVHTNHMNRRASNNYNYHDSAAVLPGVFVEHQGRLTTNNPRMW
eukprot:64341_1